MICLGRNRAPFPPQPLFRTISTGHPLMNIAEIFGQDDLIRSPTALPFIVIMASGGHDALARHRLPAP
jgi:hypothetical protein